MELSDRATQALLHAIEDPHLVVEPMTISVTVGGDVSQLRYHLSNYPSPPVPADKNSWRYLEPWPTFRSGDVVTLLVIKQTNGRFKTFYPLAVLEHNRDQENGRNQSGRWHRVRQRCETDEAFVEACLAAEPQPEVAPTAPVPTEVVPPSLVGSVVTVTTADGKSFQMRVSGINLTALETQDCSK